MWLSKKAARADAEPEKTAALAEVTIGGGSAAALSEGEKRHLTVLAPGGVSWRPEAGESVLVIRCADGTGVVAGAVRSGGTLQNGEVRICSKGASVYLRNGGGVEIAGDVSITGSLKINGAVVTAKEE